ILQIRLRYLGGYLLEQTLTITNNILTPPVVAELDRLITGSYATRRFGQPRAEHATQHRIVPVATRILLVGVVGGVAAEEPGPSRDSAKDSCRSRVAQPAAQVRPGCQVLFTVPRSR